MNILRDWWWVIPLLILIVTGTINLGGQKTSSKTDGRKRTEQAPDERPTKPQARQSEPATPDKRGKKRSKWRYLWFILLLGFFANYGKNLTNSEQVEQVKTKSEITARSFHIRLPEGEYDKYGNSEYKFPIVSFSEESTVLNFTFSEQRGSSYIKTFCFLERRKVRYYGKYRQMEEGDGYGALELERVRESGDHAWIGTLTGPRHKWEAWIDE